jgi:tetratricopeptide (TPR) repeat protein
MATVYVVREERTGELRALKLMSPGSGADEVERRFRREFRTLSRLCHPNITAVYDWGTWDDRPYFVMELLDGQDLRSLVDRWAIDPPADRYATIRSVVIQVARALQYVHRRGLIHRDVTPSNVMVLSDGTARLMDFGVVKETSGSTDLTAHGELLGTVAYVAPEQINGEGVDARTDLYSLGAVLYLLVTGRRPFNARTLAGYLDKHLHRPPRPPHEIAPDVPPDLEHVCLRLLAKEPGERYASASHLLAVLEGPMGANPLVGRDDAVATVLAGLEACREGQGSVIVVEGAVGFGKTRLTRLAMDEARAAGMPAHRIRARPSADPLAAYGAMYQALRAEGAPPQPLLERALLGEARAGVERYTLFSAFREMIGTTRPRLFVVDDLHFADPGSIELLEYLVRNSLATATDSIVWMLVRTPGIADAAVEGLALGTRTTVPTVRITLDRLSAPCVEELLLAHVPDGPAVPVLAARIAGDGAGSPALIAEIIRGLSEERILVDGALTVDAATAARVTLPVPRSIRLAVHEHLDGLSWEARQLADMLAVARQEMPIGVLAEAVGLSEPEAIGAIEELTRAGLARERRSEHEDHVDFAQTRTRDLLASALPAPERRHLHRRLGEVLERTYRRRLALVVESLAHHFEQAGVPGKAYAYLVRAGQRLLDRSFVSEAELCFRRAVELEPEARAAIVLDEADRQLADLLLRRVDALSHLGRWSEVPDGLETAERLARELGDDRLLSRAEAALGALARHDHRIDAAEAHLREAIRLAEVVRDPSLRVMPLNGLGGIVWSRGDLEGARKWWMEELAVGEATRDERSLGYGYNGLGLVALCRGQAVEARRCFEQSAEIFERIGMLGPLATARVNLVEIHHFTGNLRRGMELAEKTIATAREIDHPLGIARGRAHLSLVMVDLGRGAAALHEAQEALRVIRELDHREDEVPTLVALARAAWALHDTETLGRALEEAVGMLPYDLEGYAPIVHAWRARLYAEQGDGRAQLELERALAAEGGRWPYQECRLDLVLSRVYSAMLNNAEATRRAEAAVRRADACGFRLYALKGHTLAAQLSSDEAAVARHRRVADALARSLAAGLSREDAERFLDADQRPPVA